MFIDQGESDGFQRDFLFIFCELVFQTGGNAEITDLLLSSIGQIVGKRRERLSSGGWFSILTSLSFALKGKCSESFFAAAFEIWKQSPAAALAQRPTLEQFVQVFILLLQNPITNGNKQKNTAIDLCKSLIHLSLQDKEANLDLGTLLSGVKEGCLVEDLEIRTICLKFLFFTFAYDLVQVENFVQLFSQHFFPLISQHYAHVSVQILCSSNKLMLRNKRIALSSFTDDWKVFPAN